MWNFVLIVLIRALVLDERTGGRGGGRGTVSNLFTEKFLNAKKYFELLLSRKKVGV